jgi:hypothetical protein
MTDELVPGMGPEEAKIVVAIRKELNVFVAAIKNTGEAVAVTRIVEACESLLKQNVSKITASAVGIYCASRWGGPRASSIRNKPYTLVQVVKRYDALHRATAIRRHVAKATADRDLRIDDSAVLAYVQSLESQNKQMQLEIDRLLQGFKKLAPVQRQSLSGASQVRLSGQEVSEVERDAILAFFKRAASLGMVVDDRQRLVDGRTVFMEHPMVQLLTRLRSR